MADPKSPGKPEKFKIGERVFYKEHDWKIAEVRGKHLTLYRDRIDGQSETERISSEELRKALLK
tara:strand:+ start:638 stop:829 length:192 start_codon:yes stop_codon:yes gene_type:complete